MKSKGWLPMLLAAGLLPGVVQADSKVYSWRDGNGNMVFSQEGSSIPFDRDVEVIFLPERQREADAAPAARPEVVVPVGTRYAVPTVQADVNGVSGVDFVVDTGASITVLNRAMAESLGIDLSEVTETRTLETAQGTLTAAQVNLGTVRVGDAVVDDLVAVVVDSPTLPNLLGRNFLSHFSVTLDPQEQVLILRTPDED